MEKPKNSRRIPTGEGIMEDKKFNDIIYAYMQSVSHRDPNKENRYVWKNNFVKKDVAKLLKINFRTFQRKFDYLVDKGYVIEKDDVYELPKISNWNFYIPVDTLRFLINTSNEDVIMVYSYLGQLKESMKDQAYFTESKLLILLGYKTKSKGELRASTHSKDWEKINDILKSLRNNGLIETRERKEIYNGKEVYKTYYNVNLTPRESQINGSLIFLLFSMMTKVIL